jgi:protein-tyrosine-phosphatase
MRRVRRDPERLLAILRSAARVLIVCHGNIIRSPFAASLVARARGGTRAVTVASAGLDATPGHPPHPAALREAGARQVDLSRHAAARIGPADVATSDVIFVMDVPQLVTLRERFPAAHRKMFLLACLAPGAPLEIADPIGGDDRAFKRCFDDISKAAEPIVRTLFKPSHR